MVIDIIISVALLGALFFNIAVLCVLKEKLEKIGTYLNNENKESAPETDEKEETLEEQAVNVFNFVDDVLDGKKELEDFYNEEQQNI